MCSHLVTVMMWVCAESVLSPCDCDDMDVCRQQMNELRKSFNQLVTDYKELLDTFDSYKADQVIHCAAVSVDVCVNVAVSQCGCLSV